jgi:hypothetical protein
MEKMGGVHEHAEQTFVLFSGDQPVADAQVMWDRLSSFDVVLESGDGTFHVHMDLTRADRQSVVWKAGLEQSIAGFQVATEGIITATGWIDTASGRRLAFAPSHPDGYEYTVFVPAGPRLMTMAASAFTYAIGGNPGQTLISFEGGVDPDLPGLFVLCFALTNEQVLLLHRPDLQQQQRGQFGAARSPGF